jgi:hypothetical protein
MNLLGISLKHTLANVFYCSHLLDNIENPVCHYKFYLVSALGVLLKNRCMSSRSENFTRIYTDNINDDKYFLRVII